MLVARLRAILPAPHGCEKVELLETHISFVLLAGAYAYKIKKSVNLGFLDFTTLSARRFYCEEELRLNRRYAPQLYLAVISITGSAEDPAIGGIGSPIEYAVQMRAFAQPNLASRVLMRGELQPHHIDVLAARIAAFHDGIHRVDTSTALGTPSCIRQAAVENIDEIERLLDCADAKRELGRLRQWTARDWAALSDAFAQRRTEGFVRECHGDLHLENIALVDGEITPFDGIEFSDTLRWIDVMNEIAFLIMDLQYRCRPDLARRFLNAYLEHTGDYAGLVVLRFYLVYRGMVRAKIACVRAAQGGVDESVRSDLRTEYERHLSLAQSHLEPQRPAIAIMHGMSGCGKTTLSQGMLEAMEAVRIRSDIERKRLIGMQANSRSDSEIGGGLYREEMTERTYLHLLAGVRAIIGAGYIAIVDAAFLKRWQRQMFREYAKQHGVPFAIVAFSAREAELRARIAQRQSKGKDASEADLAVLEYQLATAEALTSDELPDAIRYDTTEMLAIAGSHETWRPLLDRLGVKDRNFNRTTPSIRGRCTPDNGAFSSSKP